MAKGRAWILVAAMLLGGAAPQGCAHSGKVKVYFSRPDLGGIYRAQEQELIPYGDTRAYRCVNPEDWSVILQLIQSCKGQ